MVFLSLKVDGNMTFADYWKVLFWSFREWEIRYFFEPKSWWKDNIYRLLKSSCFDLFGNGKCGLFLSQKVDGKMIFTDYWKVLVLNFPVMGNTAFFQSKSWWKDDIYLVFLSFPWYSRKYGFWRSESCRPKVCKFIMKETLTQVFSCEFCKICKNTFWTEHLWMTASLDSCFWNFKHKIFRVNQSKQDQKSSKKEYVMWTCFKFWPMKNNFRKIESITRNLIIFKKPRKMTNDLIVIFLGFLKVIKLLVMLFIIKLYARNNNFRKL